MKVTNKQQRSLHVVQAKLSLQNFKERVVRVGRAMAYGHDITIHLLNSAATKYSVNGRSHITQVKKSLQLDLFLELRDRWKLVVNLQQ